MALQSVLFETRVMKVYREYNTNQKRYFLAMELETPEQINLPVIRIPFGKGDNESLEDVLDAFDSRTMISFIGEYWCEQNKNTYGYDGMLTIKNPPKICLDLNINGYVVILKIRDTHRGYFIHYKHGPIFGSRSRIELDGETSLFERVVDYIFP